jgi:diguanylate cyclase (GGDEF)-like protein/PAS domain S-box-containing protein
MSDRSADTKSGIKVRVLLIEDNPGDARLIAEVLARAQGLAFDVEWVDNLTAGVARLNAGDIDVVLLDLGLPESTGLDTLRRLLAATPHVPTLVVMSGLTDEDIAVQAVQSGAQDYLVKGQVDSALLVRAIRYAIERTQAEEALKQAHAGLERRVAARTAELAKAVDALHAEITEHMQTEVALREREARIRRLVESNIIGIFFWDIGGRIIDANDAFLRIVGYDREDLVSRRIDWAQMTPAEHLAVTERATEELLGTGTSTPYEKEYVRKDGSRVPVLVGGALFEGSQEKGVSFILDLTERRRAEERIRYQAQHDALTDLPNRLLLRDRVTQAIAQAQRTETQIALLFIDLDHFKNINDSLGHQAGDQLLQAAAERLQRCLREGDSVARLGGDEFVIGLPGLRDTDDVMRMAGEVLEALRLPFFIDRRELHVSGSIGISLYPSDGLDADALMRAADTAMYHAKEKGRDNYQFFTESLNEAAQRRLNIANRLHRALERGEFTLHYQAQVELESSRIFGAEALIRWLPPEGGTIAPSEFIRIAEETGLIVPLGEWVLREACAQVARWRRAGFADLRIAVNLSPHQFLRPGFPSLAARILEQSGLPACALEMEITEGVLTMHSPENVTTLEQLANMGIALAVDDFGTGYSSLAYLQRFPISALKIDQSFVSGIGEDSNDTAIVTAIIAMAHSLRLKVIAEGVEFTEQSKLLREHGCDQMQGYLIRKPVPAEEFERLLAPTSS